VPTLQRKSIEVKRTYIYCHAAKHHTPTMPLSITATSKGGVAFLSIIGRISDWTENNSVIIGRKIDELIDKGNTDLELYIMSEGGNVFEANEIVNLIKKFTGKKTGKLGALCASAGTYIACHLDSVSMVGNGQYMIHKPMGYFEGNEDEVKSQLKAIEIATADYKKVYAQKTGKTEAEIEKLWSKGDYWMSAKQAKEHGFIDEVIGEEAVSAEVANVIRACGAPIVPTVQEVIKDNSNYSNMDITLLGFAPDAKPTDAEINAKLKAMKEQAETAEKLKKEAETKAKESRQNDIKAVLDNAEKEKKIIGTVQRANYEKLLNADFETTKAAIEGLAGLELPTKTMTTPSTATIAGRKDWTYADWQKNDYEGLSKMRTENPQEFETLANAYYTEK
jgi:ATP-dependent protease ClpP protease subunit